MEKRSAHRRAALLLSLALTALPCLAGDGDGSGSVRLLAESASSNHSGVLAPANAQLQAGSETLEEELSLKGRKGQFQAQATITHARSSPGEEQTRGLINELNWSGKTEDWHFTVGKKIVSWDVGQGFRPLDVIQQENRRTLYGSTLEGVRVAMAERYSGDSAWSLVLANPLKSAGAAGPEESAVALRYFLRRGSSDAHAVARWGRRTGAQAGLAIASVITDSLEIHASALRAEKLDRYVEEGGLYAQKTTEGGWQSLLGTSWTSENQLSLMAEYWHDSRAPSRQEWKNWRNRIESLPTNLPADAHIGQLANSATTLASTNLQRDNVLLRAAWTDTRWSPALDMLYMPADHGRITTISLAWQGDELSVEGGWRRYAGPGSAIADNLPDKSKAYLWIKYPF
ncbi:hypothetical protein [Niveibacterium terrae]|uniref:hypothetical protein n=1 Tax=Niveibacterium terrae TaxID=3373598 RepID=UPI003A95D906